MYGNSSCMEFHVPLIDSSDEIPTSRTGLSPSTSSVTPLVVTLDGFCSSFGAFFGLELRTRMPMTCPKALTPLSVRPHLLYSTPSQHTSSSAPLPFLGNINLVFVNAFHSSASTVGKGVMLLLWYSNPLYRFPRYANLSAIRRVLYLDGSKGLEPFLGLFVVRGAAGADRECSTFCVRS